MSKISSWGLVTKGSVVKMLGLVRNWVLVSMVDLVIMRGLGGMGGVVNVGGLEWLRSMVRTGNLTLPRLRDLFSVLELLENTEGGWLFGCFQLWDGGWWGLKSHRSEFYWSQNDPSNLSALISQVLFVQPGYEKNLDNLMYCVPWTSKHSQMYKSSTSSGLLSTWTVGKDTLRLTDK